MNTHMIRLAILAVLISLIIPVDGRASSIPAAPPASKSLQADKPGQTTLYLPVVSSGIPELPPIIPETTNVLPPSTTQYLSGISPREVFTFTQATAELDALAPGDIIVGEPTAAAPDGFLRAVTDVVTTGGAVVVATGPATLEEAIAQGSLHFSQALDPGMVTQSIQLPGVTLSAYPGDSTQGQFLIQVNNVLLYDKDGIPFTIDDQVKANGSIAISPQLTFDLAIQNQQLQKLQFVTATSETSTLTIDSTEDISVSSVVVEIARYVLAPITAMIGPIPVVFKPVLTFGVGMDGSIVTGVSAGATQIASIRGGLMYGNGGWSPLAAFSNQFQNSPPVLFATLGFRGFSGAKIALMLYGVLSAQAGLDASFTLESDRLSQPWWELFGGLDVSLGIENAILSHGMASANQPVIHDEILLAQSPPRPPIQSQMLTVPGGAFTMGCDALHNGGYGCLSREVPLHTVFLDTFQIDKYEVTNADYAQCVNNGYCTLTITNSKTRPSYYGNPAYDNYPKIYVSWSEANDYCFWAGKRLPTEAEWEKAARGDDDTRAFPWGDSVPDCGIANFGTVPVCVGDTNQVGSYPAGESPYGALDMAGNVAEWVSDWYQADYYTGSPSSNPTGPLTGTTKVNRGGSYGVLSEYVRIAFRNYYLPGSRSSATGFRCAAAP